MQTNHPTPELLSESVLAEIEARHKLASSGFQPYVEVDNSLADIPALCATVRALEAALRKANGIVLDAAEKNARLQLDNTALRDQLAELQRRNDTQAESIMEFQAGEKSLRAQLAQVEKELSDYKDKWGYL